ncbi:MAG TPA: zinc ribbon domain-containing protein, partial [Porphyromonadaceae bacterium]|nr:zinc ribbon domain-containing protein [Porphyromonadaceae bacterium]
MAFCTNCGNSVADGIKFCPSCGKEMAAGDVAQPV